MGKDTKACTWCGEVKPLTDYHRNARLKDGLFSHCKPCALAWHRRYREANRAKINRAAAERRAADPSYKERSRQWREANRESQAAKKRARNTRALGVEPEEYQRMLASQGGVCAICRQPERHPRKTRLSIDHCHSAGKVRGLLCSECNTGIGKFKDTPDLLVAAATYLLTNKPVKVIT